MAERTVVHATIVIERVYPATPARVFKAWADKEAHDRWHVPGGGWETVESEYDFRAGGREFSRFGPAGGPYYHSEGRFEDIAPNARIVSSGSMHGGGKRSSATLCTVEFLADGAGTRLILTDQSVFFDGGETPSMREAGWGEILDKLGEELERRGAAA